MASGEDSISGLPDELLHAILFRVRSAGDAVRTSVLSRRWRHILLRPLPEPVFEEVYFVPVPEPAPPAPPRLESFLDNVDAALAACDAPVIKGLRIVWRWYAPWSTAAASRFPTGRVEPWLRFASERVVDDLHLRMCPLTVDVEEPVVELPLSVMHLLRSCNSTRKICLAVACFSEMECLPSCPCLLEESYRIDDISLNSLEEVEITSFASSHEVLEFVELLSRCDTSNLKRVVIKHRNKSTPPTKEVREKIRSMCQPNIEVEFYVYLDPEFVPLD
ncbi:hypothetical protein HU200_034436 [Digitaria exilis]|uniref:F-box domain-containing protein n=1 Tax=Digitaria exilis TaxID=1010633 RepID=A0A835BKC6_9POAL|nr:hypothetical protein HU200_034436 [Digitaria exilis]